MTTRKTPKKRGAQPNNNNAKKHGIYSKYIAVADTEELQEMKRDKNHYELDHARARLADCSKRRDQAQDDETRLKYDHACRHWSEIIDNMLFRNANRVQTEVQIFDSLIEAVRAANDKQNVQR